MKEWPVDDEHTRGSDGIPARKQGRYASQKLEFLDKYLPPALSATRRKDRRVFLDLFAGPGLNCDKHGVELLGSPIRAITATAQQGDPVALTHYIGVNLDAVDHAALQERIRHVRERGECRAGDAQGVRGDANAVLPAILDQVRADAWICAYIDIESPKQLPWSTLAELRRRHWSVDLYLLFPLQMGWKRLIPNWPSHAHIFDAAFGCDEWRPICASYVAGSYHRVGSELLALYQRRLGTLWRHVRVERAVTRAGNAWLYQMIYATNHAAGEHIADWASKSPAGQGNLFD